MIKDLHGCLRSQRRQVKESLRFCELCEKQPFRSGLNIQYYPSFYLLKSKNTPTEKEGEAAIILPLTAPATEADTPNFSVI